MFADSGMGAPAKSARIAFGALVIQAMKNYTDEETAAQVAENPYLQYFLGMKEYQVVPLFDASMMVHFRRRFGFENAKDINDMIIQYIQRAERPTKEEPPLSRDNDGDITRQSDQGNTQQHNDEPSPNKGTLLLDATCAPSDIQYPTDLRLLNEGREKLERIIDTLYKADQREDKPKKPRTYRNKARMQYLVVAKKPKFRA
ncbi:transposase, partial [Mesotoga sp.]|uniref:transposase n=1 Tax=Mesotoga sp. TaxID=2053577 RepID=UPI001BD2BEB7